MKERISKRIALISVALCMIGLTVGCSAPQSQGKPETSVSVEQVASSNAEVLEYTENITGSADGYDYELWKDEGNTTFRVNPGGGCFSCEWSNINNALFRRGRKLDCSQTYDELGNISVKYGVDYQPIGNSYMCVYGWSKDPLIEFYIVESWGTWRPPGAPYALGNVTVDGAVYDIYKTTRYEQPSIDGTKTFDQYWSVRREKPQGEGTRIEGTISVTKHFDAWKKCGLNLGRMYEVALTVEGYQSNGKADVYKNELKIEGQYSEATDIKVTVDEDAIQKQADSESAGAPKQVGFFESDFEQGTGGWIPRGAALVSTTRDNASEGEKSLFVCGRTAYWNGATIMLSSDTYKPGEAYHFRSDVMQNSGKTVTMKMTMQYYFNGENYDEIALKEAPSGKWITLENPAYTIPEGAEGLQLYVEVVDSLTDFYLDNVSASERADK